MKPKKVAALVASMPGSEVREKLAASTSAKTPEGAGGAGAGGEAKEGEAKEAPATSEPTPEFAKLSELSEGANPGKWILLRQLAQVLRTGQTPQCLVMVDEDSTAVCVSLYHAGESACDRFESERDTFIVCDPLVKTVTLDREDGSTVTYTTLQVLKPHNFSVNGRTLSGQYAHAGLKVVNLS